MAKKYVYFFGDSKAEGDASMKLLLGGKGANLAEMVNLKIPVPAGFTISTDVCSYYYEHNGQFPAGLTGEVAKNIAKVQKAMGAAFGDPKNPLLFSVRSGAPASMPGMMDTVLNLGLNDKTLAGLIEKTKNERFVYDSYRRLIQMYGDVVMGLKPEREDEEDPFEVIIQKKKDEVGAKIDMDLTRRRPQGPGRPVQEGHQAAAQEGIPGRPDGAALGGDRGGLPLVEQPPGRSRTARSITSPPTGGRPSTSRRWSSATWATTAPPASRLPATPPPAKTSSTASTSRTPRARTWWRASGRPSPSTRPRSATRPSPSLEEEMPAQYKELVGIYHKLEKHYKEMQDIEFTIQSNKLWMLQTRTGKRTAHAAVKIAVDMVAAGLITKKEAVMRINPDQLDQLLHPMIDPKAPRSVIAKGLPASPGAAVGKVVFTANEAAAAAEKKEKVVLVRIETSPEDIHGMNAAQGILTARGGMTSHAAVVARGMGKPCVAGAGEIAVSYEKQEFKASGKTIKKGDWITLDGSRGQVMTGPDAPGGARDVRRLRDAHGVGG